MRAKRITIKQRPNGKPKPEDSISRLSKRKPVARTELSKVTLYVRPEQVVGVESIQLAERKRTGQRPDKSALVQEALDLLISKYKQKKL